MYKYLFFLTASAVPAAALAQSPSEQALAEIIDRQDADGATPAAVYAPAAAPRDAAVITVTANGLGTDLRKTGQSVTVIERDEIEQLGVGQRTRHGRHDSLQTAPVHLLLHRHRRPVTHGRRVSANQVDPSHMADGSARIRGPSPWRTG